MRRAGFLSLLSCQARHAREASWPALGQLGERAPQRTPVKTTFPMFVAGCCESRFGRLNYEVAELGADVPPKCSGCSNPMRIENMEGVHHRCPTRIVLLLIVVGFFTARALGFSGGVFNGTNVLRLIRISLVSARWLENNASRDGEFTRGQR